MVMWLGACSFKIHFNSRLQSCSLTVTMNFRMQINHVYVHVLPSKTKIKQEPLLMRSEQFSSISFVSISNHFFCVCFCFCFYLSHIRQMQMVRLSITPQWFSIQKASFGLGLQNFVANILLKIHKDFLLLSLLQKHRCNQMTRV